MGFGLTPKMLEFGSIPRSSETHQCGHSRGPVGRLAYGHTPARKWKKETKLHGQIWGMANTDTSANRGASVGGSVRAGVDGGAIECVIADTGVCVSSAACASTAELLQWKTPVRASVRGQLSVCNLDGKPNTRVCTGSAVEESCVSKLACTSGHGRC